MNLRNRDMTNSCQQRTESSLPTNLKALLQRKCSYNVYNVGIVKNAAVDNRRQSITAHIFFSG